MTGADKKRGSSAGCVRHRWNRGNIPPHGGSSGLLSGWFTIHRHSLSAAATANFEAVSAERSVERGNRSLSIRRPPRKQIGSLNMRRQTIPVPPMSDAPGTGPQACTAPSRSTPVFVQTCPKGRIWTQKRFLFHRCGDFSLTLSKKSGGRIPVPQSGTSSLRPAGRNPYFNFCFSS